MRRLKALSIVFESTSRRSQDTPSRRVPRFVFSECALSVPVSDMQADVAAVAKDDDDDDDDNYSDDLETESPAGKQPYPGARAGLD